MKWTEEDEKQPGQLEPEGIYPFEIAQAEEKVSQKGNPYINLKLRVFSDDSERTIYDIIMPQMPGKLKSFCETLGLTTQLKEKSLSITDCSVGEGFVRMAKKLNKDGYVQVEGYMARDPRGESKQPEKSADLGNRNKRPAQVAEDEVPF